MKQEVTTTLKVRLMAEEPDRESLVRTASAYRDACNFVSDHVFDSRDKKNHVYKCSHCGYQSDDDRIGAMNLYQLGLEYLKGTEQPRIQSPSSRSGGGGRRQPSCDVTSRRKARKGWSYDEKRCRDSENQC